MFSQVTQIGNIYQLPPPVDSLQWCKIPNTEVNINGTAVNVEDTNFDRLLPTLFECFAIVFCGFLAGRCNLISPSDIKGLTDFTTYFSLPPLIFLNLVTINFYNVNWYFVLGVLLGKIAIFLLVAVVTAAVHRPLNLSYAGIYGIFCTQGNDFGLAYPIVASLYGSKRPLYPGYMYLIAPTSLLFTNPMGFFMMEAQKSRCTKGSGSLVKRFFKTLGSVSWNVFKNPVVFVTLLGILGNFLFHDGLPSILYGILQILSSAFSAAVLFLLGFSVVGCGPNTTSSKEGLLIPSVLIIAKMLLSPLITRGTVAMLCASAPDVDDLSDYGFLYGMVPTGPIVMLFATEYCLRTEMMASTMVVCTALFGPFMFILARMLSLKVRGMEEFSGELRTTMLVLSILSIVSCIWVGISLAFGNKFKGHLYKITASLMISQVIMSTGVFMWAAFQSELAWVGFFVVAFVAAGQLMTRLWVALLALYLAIRQRNPLSPFIQNLSWPMAFGFGIPAAAVLMLLVMTSIGKCQPELHKELPLFIYGDSEAVASIVVLSLCLFVTTFSLVLYYRSLGRPPPYGEKETEQKDSTSINVGLGDEKCAKSEKQLTGAGLAVYKATKNNSDSVIMMTEKKESITSLHSDYAKICEKSQTSLTDDGKKSETSFKEGTSPYDGMNVASSQSSLDIISMTSTSQAASSSPSTEFDQDMMQEKCHRHLRHVILLILCCISMSVGLMISCWKLSPMHSNGLFVAMEFLDAVLNVGQGVFMLFVFWRESRHVLTPVGKWLSKVRRGFYSLENDSTDDSMTQLCRQFRKYHWDNCLRDLPRTFSTEDQSYSQCFTGKELVDWLMAVGLATHRTAGEIYCQQLVRGGLLQSANGAVQFHDSHAYFYRFKDSEKYT